MIQIYVESEDVYAHTVTSNFDTTPYTIEFSFVKRDGSTPIAWTVGTWDGASQQVDTFEWQRRSKTPKIGPDGGPDIILSAGDWDCYARINERVFYVDFIEVKTAGTPLP